MDMKSSGISRRSFEKKLVFTEAERSTCNGNDNGRNKLKLDPIKITYVKMKKISNVPSQSTS